MCRDSRARALPQHEPSYRRNRNRKVLILTASEDAMHLTQALTLKDISGSEVLDISKDGPRRAALYFPALRTQLLDSTD
jgi:hypothetical protein